MFKFNGNAEKFRTFWEFTNLVDAENESARLCMGDSWDCYMRFVNQKPWVGMLSHGQAIKAGLPTNYLESAEMWLGKAMSYQYGYAIPAAIINEFERLTKS